LELESAKKIQFSQRSITAVAARKRSVNSAAIATAGDFNKAVRGEKNDFVFNCPQSTL
jgi:hypothetical protein